MIIVHFVKKANMSNGLNYLKAHPKNFHEFQKNLSNNMCVTCGNIPLKDCDKTFGICNNCKNQITLTPKQCDDLWFLIANHKNK